MNFQSLVRKLVSYLAKENKKEHEHIAYFNPDVMSLRQSHQDFSSEMKFFSAGEGYDNFNDFITEEAIDYENVGDGVTYVVWNVLYDKDNVEIKRDMVSYYTLAATAIPYEDRIRDVFFEYDGMDLPISAWIMRSIIDFAYSLLDEVIGFKALFLHSLPEAEGFYGTNGFNPVEINMQPLHCYDSEYKPMYLALKEVHMNYDK